MMALTLSVRLFPFSEGGYIMNDTDVPNWEKYTLTIEEASKYFRIGENKLRRLAEENPSAGWIIMNGNRRFSRRAKAFFP